MKEILIVVAVVVTACGIAWLYSGADEWIRPEFRARAAANARMNEEYQRGQPTVFALPLPPAIEEPEETQVTGSP